MNTTPRIQKTVLSIYRLFFTIALFLLPFSIFTTFFFSDAHTVGSQLEHSKAYAIASDEIAVQLAKVVAENTPDIALSEKAVRRATRAVITPEVVKQKVEAYVAGNYAWLNNQRAEPVIEITIKNEQRQFIHELAKQVTAEMAQKPACDSAQILQYQIQLQQNPLAAPCTTIGMTDRHEVETAVEQKIRSSSIGATQQNVQLTPEVIAEASPYLDSVSPFLRLLFWYIKHGFMMTVSILLIAGALAFMVVQSTRKWFMWARPALISVVVGLIIVGGCAIALTQTMLLTPQLVPASLQPVIAVLSLPLIFIIIGTAIGYLLVIIIDSIVRMAHKRRHARESTL